MTQRLTFMVGFGSLGILPMVQLFVLWRFCDGETVGRTLFATTVALFIAAFCDGTSSYRERPEDGPQANRRYLLDILRIRLSRLAIASPLAAVGILLSAKALPDAVAAITLAAANVLSFAFVERNFGSVGRALLQEYQARLTCLFLPAAGAVVIDHPAGLLVGCVLALATQGAALAWHARPHLREIRPTLAAALSRDLLSGLLSLVYVSFSQLATAALLTPLEFARFITIDRIVRAGLLVTEPARLLYLRRSWAAGVHLSRFGILGSAFAVAACATAAIVVVFGLGIPNKLLGVDHGPGVYLFVCFLTSMVSFTTLCGFVRFNSLRTVNALLGLGLAAGVGGFAYAFRQGPFTAALTFETIVCVVVIAGALATNFGRRRESVRPEPSSPPGSGGV